MCSPGWELVALSGSNLDLVMCLRKWTEDLPVALCNPLPVWPVFQVLVPNGWFPSNTKAWRTSFQVSYGSLQFVITPILAPKNGSGWDWQNPSCCRDAKSWELDAFFRHLSWLCLRTMVSITQGLLPLQNLDSRSRCLEPAAGSKEFSSSTFL